MLFCVGGIISEGSRPHHCVLLFSLSPSPPSPPPPVTSILKKKCQATILELAYIITLATSASNITVCFLHVIMLLYGAFYLWWAWRMILKPVRWGCSHLVWIEVNSLRVIFKEKVLRGGIFPMKYPGFEILWSSQTNLSSVRKVDPFLGISAENGIFLGEKTPPWHIEQHAAHPHILNIRVSPPPAWNILSMRNLL